MGFMLSFVCMSPRRHICVYRRMCTCVRVCIRPEVNCGCCFLRSQAVYFEIGSQLSLDLPKPKHISSVSQFLGKMETDILQSH